MKPTAKKETEPEIVQPPLEKWLSWDNHKLRSVNFELMIQNLRMLQDIENKAAADELDAMQKAVGDEYVSRVRTDNGQLEFVRKRKLAPKPEAKSFKR